MTAVVRLLESTKKAADLEDRQDSKATFINGLHLDVASENESALIIPLLLKTDIKALITCAYMMLCGSVDNSDYLPSKLDNHVYSYGFIQVGVVYMRDLVYLTRVNCLHDHERQSWSPEPEIKLSI